MPLEPCDADLPHRARCSDGQFDDPGAGHGGRRQQRHAEPRRHQAAQRLGLLALEGDPRREPGLAAQVVGHTAQPVTGFEGHEGLLGGLGEPDAPAAREPVVGRDDQPQLLLVEAARDEVGGVRHRRGEAQVEFPRAQLLEHRLAVVLDEAEAHARMAGAEGVDQAGHGLGAHRVQKAEGDLAGRGVGVRAHLLGAPLDLAEGALHGCEERASGRGERDRATAPGEQLDAQVVFEPDQRPGQGGLRDLHLLRGPRDVLGPRDTREVREPRREQGDDVCCVTCVTG